MAVGEAHELFDRMLAAGHGMFALAEVTEGVGEMTERERALVEAALAAGVVGALTVLREDRPPNAKP